MREIFRKNFFKNGRAWRFLTDEERNYYWEEFKKGYWWDEAVYSETIIKNVFMKHAADRYKTTISKMRSDNKKHASVSEDTWVAWKAFWETTPEKNKSNTARSNRMSEVEGPGTGPVRHTAGSASAIIHMNHLQLELGRKPTPTELYIQMHATDVNKSVMVDKRSQNMKDALSERLASQSPPLTGEGDSSTSDVDHTKLFLDIEGVNKKKVYGLGSAAAAYVDTAGSKVIANSTSSMSQQNEEEVDRLVQQNNQMSDKVAELEAQVVEQNKHLAESEKRMFEKMNELAEHNKQMAEQMVELTKKMIPTPAPAP